MGRVTKNLKRGNAMEHEAGAHPCAYPMNVDVPSITDMDSELGFKDNGEHAIHRENKKKNKGISPTHAQ